MLKDTGLHIFANFMNFFRGLFPLLSSLLVGVDDSEVGGRVVC